MIGPVAKRLIEAARMYDARGIVAVIRDRNTYGDLYDDDEKMLVRSRVRARRMHPVLPPKVIDAAARCVRPQLHELGFYFLPAYHGRGYAVEAARGVIAFAFGELRAAALFAGHHPENAASQRTLEKLGFRYTHDEPYPPTGRDHPGYELRHR